MSRLGTVADLIIELAVREIDGYVWCKKCKARACLDDLHHSDDCPVVAAVHLLRKIESWRPSPQTDDEAAESDVWVIPPVPGEEEGGMDNNPN